MCDYKLLHGLDFFLGMNHIKFFFSDVLVSFYFIDFLESWPLLRDLMPPFVPGNTEKFYLQIDL